ncbi:MAG: hypothetical protein JRJ60_11630, partial [Deltaproteobacteria bacterium]|nr:hypothetical protein [Deltaproteobacteria bacterium]
MPALAADLRRISEEAVARYALGADWWRPPLLSTAAADHRFDVLPRIASSDHLLPRDLLVSAKSVIVFFIPFKKKLLDENTPGKFPCRNWGVAYQATNRLIEHVSGTLQAFLAEQGHRSALTPATHNFDPIGLTARWSHKHLAHLCGLGRFGINRQLITPAGCGGRLGSLVTEADLGDSPLMGEEELCLHKQGETCLRCVALCPVAALEEHEFDRQRCYTRLKVNLHHTEALAGLEETTEVCGKCVVDLPCTTGSKGSWRHGPPPPPA